MAIGDGLAPASPGVVQPPCLPQSEAPALGTAEQQLVNTAMGNAGADLGRSSGMLRPSLRRSEVGLSDARKKGQAGQGGSEGSLRSMWRTSPTRPGMGGSQQYNRHESPCHRNTLARRWTACQPSTDSLLQIKYSIKDIVSQRNLFCQEIDLPKNSNLFILQTSSLLVLPNFERDTS